MNPTRTASAASACTLLFGAVHVAWSLAYYYFPAFGRVTLGSSFERSFGRPAFMAYDLVVAALFVVAAALPLASVRAWGARLPRWLILSGLTTAAGVLGLRGAAGAVVVILVSFGALEGAVTRWVVYDAWFLLCGWLLGASARHAWRSAPAARPTPAPQARPTAGVGSA